MTPALRIGAVLVWSLSLTACAEDDGPWDVETPERYVYDDTRAPSADVPADPTQWSAHPAPFVQSGVDDGAPGIVYSAALAGYYIMRIQDSAFDEHYHYQYDPLTATWEESDNIHRKCGATFTQVWLYRFTRRPEFGASTVKALEYLVGRAVDQDDGSLRLRDLGATSLVLLSLTEYARLAPTDAYDETIDRLGAHLLSRVLEDGSFSEGSPLIWAQAHQALWRLYAHTGDPAYLDVLERVGRFFYDHRDDPEIIDYPYLYGLWANEPLTELYQVRPADWIAQFVLEVGDDVAAQQYIPTDDIDPDWIGGYDPNGGGQPGWNSTLKLEAVIDAYRMATLVDDAEHIERFRKSALLGTEFLQRLQHRVGETDAFADGTFAIGGTPFSLTDPTVRLDVPHHMANAILKVVEYLDLEDYPGRSE
jgi:hypothetical protein